MATGKRVLALFDVDGTLTVPRKVSRSTLFGGRCAMMGGWLTVLADVDR
jgi:hypothetical protein